MNAAEDSSFVVGLIGSGIQGSLSPALHERAGRRLGLHYSYQLIDLETLGVGVEALPNLLDAAEQNGFRGLNITYPCKQAVISHLHELSDDARRIGAVNTVVLKHGRRIGYNTDCSGFARGFRDGASGARLDRVVQLGAGGAGAAVAQAILELGARCVMLKDVDARRAQRLARDLSRHFGADRAVAVEDLSAVMDTADGVIHATPTGMAKHPGVPLKADLLKPWQWVAEIVYFPLETELLRMARQKGCLTIDGSGMAIHQAAGAFQLFTEREPDPARMRRDFDELVQSSRSKSAPTSAAQ
jgi:shikimate dehydrogenase